MSERYIAVSEKNNNGIVQYVSVNVGDMLEYIDDMGSYAEEPAYISIGYYDTTYKSRYTDEFPCIDINIYLSGAITVYNDMALVRHFKNDPGKIYDMYQWIVTYVEEASCAVSFEDIFISISDKIFNILREKLVHELEVPTLENYLRYTPRFVDLKYDSTFLGIVKDYGEKPHCRNTVRLNNRLVVRKPLLLLHKILLRGDVELLIFPDGSIIIKDSLTWLRFDEIYDFCGEEILLFCEKCSNLYKSVNGDIATSDIYSKYEELVEGLLQNL
jgi:hypothetical protein